MSLIPFGFWKTKYQYLPSADYPTYCWSFWKRNPNYTGSCIRIKLESGGAEYDIGFAGDGFLNVANMQSLVGSGTAYVIKWYEQFSGNSAFDLYPHYLSGSGLGYAPRIIINGVLKTFVNGAAAVDFNSGWAANFCMMNCGSGTTMVSQFTSTLYWSEEAGSSLNQNIFGNNNENARMAIRELNLQNFTTVFYDFGVDSNYFINESKELNNGPLSDSAYSDYLYSALSYKISTQGARLVASRGVGYNSLGTGFSVGGRWSNPSGYFRGLTNEVLIYNGTTHSESKVRDIQSVLNLSHNFYNTTSVTNNLVLWYDAGNSSCYPGSGTSITDLSTGGANATLVNGVTYSSADGGKFILDGVNDWIGTSGTNIYPWMTGSSDYTVECWVKFTNANQSARIFSNRNSSSGSMMSLIGGTIDINGNITSSKKISFAITNGNATRSIWQHTTNDIIDGNWKHIVATRTENRILKIYINGVDQGLTTVNNAGSGHIYIDTGTSWRVADGGGGTGGNGAFEISIIRLYKCQLNQTQVTRNFNLEKSRYGL